MKRITVAMVKRAYKKSHLEPIRDDFGDGVECGCPLTAICAAAGDESPADSADGLVNTETYYEGFVSGVDDVPDTHSSFKKDDDAFVSGYSDGLAVRNAIFGDTA
jgi:hypothetical protein